MADPRSESVSKGLQTEALHPSCQTSQMVERRTRRKKLIPMKYSFEEIHERLGNGLCIFCDEQDSPSHQQQKHKNFRVVVMESDNNSHFNDDRVLETKLSIDEVGVKKVTATITMLNEETIQKKTLMQEISQEAKSKSVIEGMKTEEISDSLQNDESHEVNKSTMMTCVIPQYQVLFSFLEPSFRCKNSYRFILEKLQDASVRSLCQYGFECLMGKNGALQMFDTMSMREQKLQQRRKLSAAPKTLKFKYKQRYPPHLLQTLDTKDVRQIVNPEKEKATLVFVFKEEVREAVNSQISLGGYLSSQSLKKITEIDPYMLELLRAVKEAEEGLLHLKHARLLQEDDILLQGLNHYVGVKVGHLDSTNELEPVLVETATAILKLAIKSVVSLTLQKQDSARKDCEVYNYRNHAQMRYLHYHKMFKGGGSTRIKEHFSGKEGQGMTCDQVLQEARLFLQQCIDGTVRRRRKRCKTSLEPLLIAYFTPPEVENQVIVSSDMNNGFTSPNSKLVLGQTTRRTKQRIYRSRKNNAFDRNDLANIHIGRYMENLIHVAISSLRNIVHSSLKDQEKTSFMAIGCHVYVTGHRLEGALVTLLVLVLTSSQLAKCGAITFTMYNFGSPRADNKNLAAINNQKIWDPGRS